MCKTTTRPFLWAIDGGTVITARPNCKMWKCPDCAEVNRRQWAQRIYQGVEQYQGQGDGFYFATMTSHEKLKAFDATVKVWPKVWTKLYARMKRVNPHLHYAMLPEQHEDGRLHMHAIISEGFGCTSADDQGHWLKDNLRSCGGGYIADIRPLDGAALAAWYVTKYVGKSLGVLKWPENFRRVRVSNHWPDLADNADFNRPDLTWTVETDELRFIQTIENYKNVGYRVVGLTTGEIY